MTGKRKGKSWAEKLAARTEPKVEVLEKAFGGMPEGGRMLISTPQAIRDYMAAQPKGTAGTIADKRKKNFISASNVSYFEVILAGLTVCNVRRSDNF